MIRSHMIKILLDREFRRLRKNPSALMLLGLLSAVALLMATSRPVSNKGDQPRANGTSQAAVDVWLIYDQRSRWLDHLAENLPDTPTIRIVHRDRVPIENRVWKLPPRDAAVEIVYGDEFETSQGSAFGKVALNGRYPGKE